MLPRFRDRFDAGRKLAQRLVRYADRPDLLVLALPRGGVPVGYELARELRARMDVFMVRKLGVPGHEELAMGAIAHGGIRVLNRELIRAAGITDDQIAAVEADEQRELERRERSYRGDRPPLEMADRTVILVDDGLATGSTMRAAVQAVRQRDPAELMIAVPVAAQETCEELRGEVDDIICAITPEPFRAVGLWYEDFSPTTDEEVRTLLQLGARREGGGDESGEAGAGEGEREVGNPQPGAFADRTVRLEADGVLLEGSLSVPERAAGVVLFAHGSGSSRRSPRNRSVASELQRAGLGTLLLDLLSPEEEAADAVTARLRFDIGLLAERLVTATDWLASEPSTRALSVGYFGASTGGGAALVAAAIRSDVVGAVVSRGGRPDLAGAALRRVRAPTLLLVGSRDLPVIGMNREAMRRMESAEVRLEIVPDASHLFEEPGKLEAVAHLARDWFLQHLGKPPAGERLS